MMAYGTNQGTKLVGYCKSSSSEPWSRLILLDFTGASNATFSLSLSLVTGNVGGNTKKMVSSAGLQTKYFGKLIIQVASALVFIGVGLGNVIGPYAFFESQAPHYTTGVIVCMISRIAEVCLL